MNFKTMGVINVTPNSFSDGGELKDPSYTFKKVLNEFDIGDIGAESTAPFNDPIEAKTELIRLESFFSKVLDAPDPEAQISIDTYRPEVFYEVALEINRVWPKSRLIFNDISGKIDFDLMELMKTELPFSYVFSHNLCPARDLSSHHMDYVFQGEFEEFMREVARYFKDGLEKLRVTNREIIIDPCFGFSKTKEQNLGLLKELARLSKMIEGDEVLMVGISRKSFLRVPKGLNAKDPKNQERLDHLQSLIALDLVKKVQRPMIFRSHRPQGFAAIRDAIQLSF